MSAKIKISLLLAGTAAFLVTAAYAQVQTATSVAHGPSTSEVMIERGEIMYVSGNDVMVKMDDGLIRDFPNVPENARIDVDGKMLGVHDLKPGMKVQKTTITTTTPKVVTTVQTVTGKVWHIQAPNSVILTLEDGTNQRFTIPKGQKFNVDGQMLDAFAVKKGMKVTATKVVEEPQTMVSRQQKLTGKAPMVATIPSDQTLLIASGAPTPAAAEAATSASGEPAPTKLPKTGSNLPVLALLGFVSLSLALVCRIVRSRV